MHRMLLLTGPAKSGKTNYVLDCLREALRAGNPSVRLLVLEVLSELGYTAIEAEHAQRALDLLQSVDTLDLMITDVGLPGLNGRQLAEMVRQSRPDLPILFMTGYAPGAAVRTGAWVGVWAGESCVGAA